MTVEIDQLQNQRIGDYELGECVEFQGDNAVYMARKVVTRGVGLYSSLPIPGVSHVGESSIQSVHASIRRLDRSTVATATADELARWQTVRHRAIPPVVDVAYEELPDLGLISLIAYQPRQEPASTEDVLASLLYIHSLGLSHGDLRRWLDERTPLPPIPGSNPWQDVEDLAEFMGHQLDIRVRSSLHTIGELLVAYRRKQAFAPSSTPVTGSIEHRDSLVRYTYPLVPGHRLLVVVLPEHSLVSIGVMVPSESIDAIGRLSASSRSGVVELSPGVRCGIAVESHGIVTVIDVVLVGDRCGVTRFDAWIEGAWLFATWNWPTDTEVKTIRVLIGEADVQDSLTGRTRGEPVTFARHKQHPRFETRIANFANTLAIRLLDERTGRVLAQSTATRKAPSRSRRRSFSSERLSE